MFANMLFNEGKFGVASLSPPFVAFYVKARQMGQLKQRQEDAFKRKGQELYNKMTIKETGNLFKQGGKLVSSVHAKTVGQKADYKKST